MRYGATTYAAAFACLGLLALPLSSGAQNVDYAHSQISFVSVQMKVPVEAVFRKFTAQISFDPAKPEASKAQIEIDLASFDIGNDEINNDVKDKNWFDTRNFPAAKFVATGVRALGPGRYEARGPLTIKGRTNDIIAPFTVKADGGSQIFEGGFAIRRLQYNLGEGVWKDTDTVADEVQIKFRIYVSGKPPPKK